MKGLLTCPYCDGRNWNTVRWSPVNPAEDTFFCKTCNKHFGRYTKAPEKAGMKLRLKAYEKEGWLASFGLMLPDGETVLQTPGNLVFDGKRLADRKIAAFRAFVEELVARGFEVENIDRLDEIK